MEQRHVSHSRTEDKSSIIAAFFLGIATTLFILIYYISIPNILVFSFLSLATLIIFLTIAILLARPRTTQKIVKIRKVEPIVKEVKEEKKEEPKEAKYIGSTKTQVYHKNTCRFAKSIKPQYKAESDEKSFFKKYKPCQSCKPQK